MAKKIKDELEFKIWIKNQLLFRKTTQKAIAQKMGVPETRISEATNLRPGGKKYIIPLIEELGGNTEDFKKILKENRV